MSIISDLQVCSHVSRRGHKISLTTVSTSTGWLCFDERDRGPADPPKDVTPKDVRRCSLVNGRPDPSDPGPRLDRRFGPRRAAVVIRRR